MASEAVLLRQTSIPISYTVADATGIEKGALLQLNDPNTAIKPTANNCIVAGIAAAEKIASTGETKLAVHNTGDFKVVLSGTATIGDQLGHDIGGENVVYSQVIETDLSGSRTFGVALEDGTDGQTIRMRLNPQETKYL